MYEQAEARRGCGCLPPLLSTLAFETGSLTEPGGAQWAPGTSLSLHPSAPALELRCTSMPRLLLRKVQTFRGCNVL